jgi:TRAP-type C4-dicarboxylate transport system permease small subunit
MEKLVHNFYRLLMLLSCISMLTAFGSVVLGVFAREVVHLNIPGLDAYAGYAIAGALFLALPGTLQNGDHIRVTLVLERLPEHIRSGFEWFCLVAALALSLYMASYGVRSVWISYITHDVSASADATPLWIPQISMALGCIGFALAFAHALILRLQGKTFMAVSESARSE